MTASKLEESIEALANSLFRPDKGKLRRDDFIAGLKYFAEAVRGKLCCEYGEGKWRSNTTPGKVIEQCDSCHKESLKPPEAQKCKCVCHGQTGPMCWVCEEDKGCLKLDNKPAALPAEVLEEVDSLAKAYAETAIGSGVNPSVYRDRLIKLCLRVGEKRLEEKRK